VTFLLRLSPEEGASRQLRAAKRQDRMEREGVEFHRRVARGYEELAGRVTGIVPVDGAGSIEEVRRAVRRELVARYPETFAGAGFTSDRPGPSQGPGSFDL
jgi:thymidylate kinase